LINILRFIFLPKLVKPKFYGEVHGSMALLPNPWLPHCSLHLSTQQELSSLL